MKPGANRKAKKPARKVLALFSRISGLGVAGFSRSVAPQKKDENTVQGNVTITVENDTIRTFSFSQNQQPNPQPSDSETGKSHHHQTSVDLWF